MTANILNFTYDELTEALVENGFKPFLAKQIYDWVYKKLVFDFDQMSNIKKTTIDWLKENYYILTLNAITTLDDKDLTTKFLFELPDGNKIETVVMNFEYGNSICVTTQVGCNMGCKFCASGTLKKVRDLTAGEIVAQVIFANKYLREKERNSIRNIVVMGIGEPFDNYKNLKNFLNIIRNDLGVGIGSRKITVSTCGLVNRFDEFTKDFDQVGLAISLHASNNEVRNKIMPINQAYDINALINKAKEYTEKTNRRVTFEYIMLKNVNDKIEHASELADLLSILKPELYTVNLIPYNSVIGAEFTRSPSVRMFYEELRSFNIITTVRQEKGTSIDGACGQLRAKSSK